MFFFYLYYFLNYYLFYFVFIEPKKTHSNETNSETTLNTNLSKNRTISETEFVSDTFQTSAQDLEEVKAGIKKLGIDTLAQEKDGKI